MTEIRQDGYSSPDNSSNSDYDDNTTIKKYKCTYNGCNERFLRPSRLKAHLRRHVNDRPFKCKESNCDKAYFKNDSLEKHQKRCHFKEVANVMCSVEGCMQVLQKDNLKKHILRKHNMFRKYKYYCSECNKGFRKETELDNHSTQHTDIYTCPVCEKVFLLGHRFRRHIKIHKSYKCICEEEFFEPRLFFNHKKNCDLCRPVCQICMKSFKTNSNLNAHVKSVHVESLTKFRCMYEGCSRIYAQLRNLTKHINEQHFRDERAEKIVCETCNKEFAHKDSFRKHNKNFHLNSKIKIEKPRKPRFDKGIPKIPMTTKLTGFELTAEENKSRVQLEKELLSKSVNNENQ